MEMKSLTIGGKTYDEFNPAAAAMNKKLDKTGGTLTGNVNMFGYALQTEQIELKTGNIDGVVMYSESTEDNTVNKPVLSLYGSSADQAVTIFNVETPTRPYEAANKKYVDSLYATPNNAPLTFTGAVEATYDGTENVTVNIPSGGSSEDMRVIKTITITDDGVNSIYFNRDDNGLPFALTKHIRIRMYGAAANTGSTAATLFFRAGQTTGDALQSQYPIKVNSHNTNYVFDFIWDLYSAANCWYGDYSFARAGTKELYRYVPSDGNNVSDITVSEIKLVWSSTSIFFQKGATIVVEGM